VCVSLIYDAHGDFTPEMMKLPQATWIETFVEGVTDKSTGLPIFKEIAWFAYKVSGVMYSVSHVTGLWARPVIR
jgi:formylmethanofuran dehydrogenase subunit D